MRYGLRSLKVRFGARNHFDEFRDYFQQFGKIIVHQITTPQTPGSQQYRISAEQREALLATYDHGYYNRENRCVTPPVVCSVDRLHRHAAPRAHENR